MTDYGLVYVIDNNALSQLKCEHRSSGFFKQHCRIPSAVLDEAEGFPDIEELRHLEYPTSAGVLVVLIDVMASVPVGETTLVDLYANLGTADPLVIATALDGQRRDNLTLFVPTWTVVSGDKAVLAKAKEFEVAVKTNHEFLAILEHSMSAPDG